MKKLVFTLSLVVTAALGFSQAPGSVSSGLAIWLKADAGTSSAVEGDFLASWNDQSGNGRNATQTTSANRPRFRRAILNGNPAVETTGGGRYFNIDLASISNSNFTVFVVAQRTSSAVGQYVLGVQQSSPVGLHLGYASDNTLRMGQSSSILNLSTTGYAGSNEIPRTLLAEFSNTSGRTLSEYLNGAPAQNTLAGNSSYAISSNTGVIGKGYSTTGFAGFIGEIIIYNRTLTATEKRQVLTYLSVKYGTTITDTDHLYFSGTGYDNDEVGIGINTAQGLSKVDNKSVNSDGLLELSSVDLSNGTYVVAGNDNGALTFSAAGGNGNCAINTLLNRKWKATVTGSVATVDLKFALTPLTYNASQICLVVDPEANGFSDEAPIAGVISNDSILFSSVRLADGALFTLAEGLTKYYAVSTGNASGAIWATTPAGTPGTISLTCGKFSLELNPGVTVTGDAAISCNGLKIPATSTFNMGNFTLHAIGDIDVNGTFAATGASSQILLDGKYAQQLRGTQNYNIQGLTINNTNGVSINAPGVRAARVVQINAGTLATNGKLVLTSDVTSTGSIGPLTSGNITGNVTVNRRYQMAAVGNVNLGSASGGYTMLCTPIQNKTVNDWADDFITSGFPGSQYPALAFNNIQYYVESAPGNYNIGFAGVASMSEQLVVGRGYFIYMNNGVYNFDVDGAINKGNITLPVSYTNTGFPAGDGRNLIANPYPSAIDWDAVGWTKTNMTNTVYVWNPSIYQYATYTNGVSTYGGSSIIPSSQAFYVVASGANPVLTITESVKTSALGTFKSGADLPKVTLKMSNGTYEDETVIVFDESETAHFNKDVDGMKMRSEYGFVPTLCSVDEMGIEYAINRLSGVDEIPFIAHASEGGLYRLSVEGLEKGWEILDNRTGEVYPVVGNDIVLDLSNGEEKEIRFTLRKSLSVVVDSNAPLAATVVGSDVKIWEAALAGEICYIQVFNNVGALVQEFAATADDTGALTVPCKLSTGMYIVKVTAKAQTWNKSGKVMKM
jgi:hypothetical protein